MRKIYGLIIILTIHFSSVFGQSGLSVHGYLNQAFAITDGHQIFGIPEKGTTDYRNLALQFRYDVNENSNFVIQFSHKRVGLNPLMVIEEDVRLDWGYFKHHFNEHFSAKVGKIQIPLGNYNEYRDVGVLLPFYSVPSSPYGDGNYMSETVDGLLLSYQTELPMFRFFEFNIYGGHWSWQEFLIFSFPGSDELIISTGIIEINNGIGGQIRLGSPIEELEFGFGGQYMEPIGGLSFAKDGYFGKQMKMYDMFFFIKGDFQHFFVGSDIVKAGVVDHSMSPLMFNSHIGFHLSSNIDINLQYEIFNVYDTTVPEYLVNLIGKKSKDINFNSDFALGIKYNLSSNLVLKAETHWNEGYFIEDAAINQFQYDPVKTRYAIFSIATSF